MQTARDEYKQKVIELAKNGEQSKLSDIIRARFENDHTAYHGVVSPSIGCDFSYGCVFLDVLSFLKDEYPGACVIFAHAFTDVLMEDIKSIPKDSLVGNSDGYLMGPMLHMFHKTIRCWIDETYHALVRELATGIILDVDVASSVVFNQTMRVTVAMSLLSNYPKVYVDFFSFNLQAALDKPENINHEIFSLCCDCVAYNEPQKFATQYFWKLCNLGLTEPWVNGWLNGFCWYINERRSSSERYIVVRNAIDYGFTENLEYRNVFSKYYNKIFPSRVPS